MRNNCHTCRHLEWHDDDGAVPYQGNSGYGCNKRDKGGENTALLKRLESDVYLSRAKRCFEPKGAA